MSKSEENKGEASSEEEEEEKFEQSTCDKIMNTLLCRPDFAKMKLEARPVGLTKLFRYATRYDKFLVALGILLAVPCGIGVPAVMILGGYVANELLTTEQPVHNDDFWRRMYVYIYIYAAVGVASVAIAAIQFLCFKIAASNVSRRLRSEYVKAILRQEAGWFDSQNSGTLTTQLNENIKKIEDGIGDKLGLILRGLVMFVASIVIGFIYQWRMCLVMLGMGPVSAVVMSSMARVADHCGSLQLKSTGEAGAIIEECVMNVRTVAACNAQQEMITRYGRALAAARRFALRIYAFSGFFDGLFFLVMYIFAGGGVYYGAWLYKVGVFADPGFVFLVANTIVFGSYYLGVLSPHLMAVMSARVAAAVIYKTIDRRPHIDGTSSEGCTMNNVQGEVAFNDVHFCYPTRPKVPILKGLSWTAKAGDTVALVGHSGCGKSTSIGLLTRLYDCISGSVTIDGVNIRKMNINWLRNIVGVVQQEPLLFNGTIKENVRLGAPDLSDVEVINACKTANAHDFIEKLADGYNTLLGSGGVQLSGGQKQRIAIARTVARNPRILLLDEATSALDAESEIIVQSALKKASVGRTTIVIAHRLSTLRDSKQIVVIEEGRVAEVGTHAELCAKEGGIYAGLVKSQRFQGEDSTEPVADDAPATDNFSRSSVGEQRMSMSSVHSSHLSRCSMSRHSTALSMPIPRVDESELEVSESGKKSKKKGSEKGGVMQLYMNCHGNYIKFITATILSIIRGTENLFLVGIIKYAFDALAEPDKVEMMKQILGVMIAYLVLGVGCLIFIFAATFSFGWTAECIVDSLRLSALRNVLYQDASYFDDPSQSQAITVTRISTDAPNIKAALDTRLMQMVNNFAGLFAMMIMALVQCWPIGLLGSGCFILLVTVIFVFAYFMQSYNDAAIKADRTGELAIEIVEQVRTIQLLTREEHFAQLYDSQLRAVQPLYKRSGPFEALLFALCSSFMAFTDLASYALGTSLVYHDKADPSEIYTAAVSISMGGYAVLLIAANINTFILAGPACDSIFHIIKARNETGDIKQGKRPPIHGNVLFNKVDFSYPTRPHQKVLNGLSLMALQGQTVAVVGPSGSGKSTVICLLERFYERSSGILKVDGTSINELSLEYLRDEMALVGQEPVLFRGTVAENVLLGTTGKTIDDVRGACKMANACDFIEATPHGYDTEVGERGTQLSGGQKQRIAIARALIRNPKILLLDEATSALDAESERAVQQALDTASSGRTCITVAHRLSSIQFANRIFFIENGRVVEQGTHLELIEANGKYADLIRKQDLKS